MDRRVGHRYEALNVVESLERYMDDLIPALEPAWLSVNSPAEFGLADCVMVDALCLAWRPNLILEVGRGYGNSTVAFLDASNRLGCSFVSVDVYGVGWKETLPKLERLKGSDWCSRVTIVDEDFRTLKLRVYIPRRTGRILFFWDAHGEELAKFIIEQTIPILQEWDSLVIVHDVSDTHGGLIQPPQDFRGFSRGPFVSPFDELLVLHDYLAVQRTDVRSPARDMAEMMRTEPERWKELNLRWPRLQSDCFARAGHWIYFRLPHLPKKWSVRDLLRRVILR